MSDMLVKLYDLPEVGSLVSRLDAQGVVVRRAMAYEKHAVVKWVGGLFGDGWASECDVAFSNHPISCFIATAAGSLAGFTGRMYWSTTTREFEVGFGGSRTITRSFSVYSRWMLR